jgi:hypothetical protein
VGGKPNNRKVGCLCIKSPMDDIRVVVCVMIVSDLSGLPSFKRLSIESIGVIPFSRPESIVGEERCKLESLKV